MITVTQVSSFEKQIIFDINIVKFDVSMKIDHLKTFLTIIETGSLSKAAERLNMTQSTVSARLKSLEDEMGQPLINRKKSGITMTAAGSRLQGYAEAMQDLWRQARHEIALPAIMGKSVSLGVHTALWDDLGQASLSALYRRYPTMPITIRLCSSQELKESMEKGLIDAALAIQPSYTPDQVMHELSPGKLILVSTRADSPVMHDRFYVFVEYSSEFSRLHAAAYHSAGTARLSFNSPRQCLDFLLDHGGSAYMPQEMAEPYIKNGELHALGGAPEFQLPRYLVMTSILDERVPELARIMKSSSGLNTTG